jgi:hypothetical protein
MKIVSRETSHIAIYSGGQKHLQGLIISHLQSKAEKSRYDFMKSSLDLLSNEYDVPVPVIEKIVYLKLSDTVLELIHMPDSIIGKDFHFAWKATTLKTIMTVWCSRCSCSN